MAMQSGNVVTHVWTYRWRRVMTMSGCKHWLPRAAVADNVATKRHDSVVLAILDTMWVPEYQAEIQ
jgi:hypothetical protein